MSMDYFSGTDAPDAVSTESMSGPIMKNCGLHLVGYAGKVVCSGVSEARNVVILFFILGWHHYGFQKTVLGTIMPNFYFVSGGICGSHRAFWCVRRM
jgi:hypothetical protein